MRPNRLAFICLIFLTLIWGYNWVALKIALQAAPPFSFLAIRTVSASLGLFGVMVFLGIPLYPQQFTGTLLFGLLQTGAAMGLNSLAMVTGGAGKTAVLNYTMPFWTLLFGWIFLKERIQGKQWIGLILALVGLLLLLLPFDFSSDLQSKSFAVLSGMLWALSAILAKKLNQKTSLNLLSFTAWQSLLGSLPLLLIALVLPAPPINWTTTFWVALIYIIVPGTAVAWMLWIYILKHLPTGTASLGTLAIPVIGVLAAALQLGEIPTLTEWSGMVFILLALGVNMIPAFNLSPR